MCAWCFFFCLDRWIFLLHTTSERLQQVNCNYNYLVAVTYIEWVCTPYQAKHFYVSGFFPWMLVQKETQMYRWVDRVVWDILNSYAELL
jgi:hypothetical protein